MPVNNPDIVFAQEIQPALGRLYPAALRYTRNPTIAEDLVQDVALRAWRFRQSFQPGTNARAWVHTILRNTAINAATQRARDGLRCDTDLVEHTARTDGDLETELDAEAEASEAKRLVYRALESLAPLYRDAIVAVDLEGLPYREAAPALGCPIGTVMSRLHRGRRALRIAVAELH